jgi:hypothetical protein
MNFSTLPPNDSISRFAQSWYGPSTACTSSGSRWSDCCVKPTRSTKMTLTTRRSSRGAAAVSSRPQARQKRACEGFSCPQFPQVIMDTP